MTVSQSQRQYQHVFFAVLLLGLAGIKGFQTLHYILPVWSESGESGRDSVGDGVPTPRLFLLLLRQLKDKERTSTVCQDQHTSLISICHHNLNGNVMVVVSILSELMCFNS